MSRIADHDQRKQALQPDRSFIVQAPAGSGKTELLIQRFLLLLSYVEYPEQILAMTFTRKAAGEMKFRIIAALENAHEPTTSSHEEDTRALAKKALDQDEKQNWRLLENPDRLKIQTIDSFCASLTQQMPLISKLGGTAAIQENSFSFYQETAQRILQQMEHDTETGEAVRTVMRHLDNSKSSFIRRIVQLLQKRDQWFLPFFEQFQVGESFRPTLEKTLAGLVESYLLEIYTATPPHIAEALPALAKYCGDNLFQLDANHPLACLRGLNSLPLPTAEFRDHWVAIANLFLTKDGDLRKSINKNLGFPPGKVGSPEKEHINLFAELLESLIADDSYLAELKKIKSLPATKYKDEEWKVLEATLSLLPEISITLRQVFRERQKTDFTEISLAALEALGKEDDPTDLLLYLDLKYQHILVDEFQDTSFKQYELLKRLTAGWECDDGRSLFIVGDPMQSIYRFRDAEVGLFLKSQEQGIGQVQLQPLSLKTNFRSQSRVVSWVNNCFSKVFPDRDEGDLGAISYSPSTAFLSEESFPGTVLHPIPYQDDKNSGDRQEAVEIVQLVQQLQEDQPDQSIAILVRARNHLAHIIPAFRQASITFKAEEIDPLTVRPDILDLLALMRALLSPMDRIAWLSILRAPWCGCSLEDLLKLCVHDESSPVWHLLQDDKRLAEMSADGQQRLLRVRQTLSLALEHLHKTNFRDLLEACWVQLGGPSCVDATTMEDAEVFFDEVSRILEEGELRDLENFHKVLQNLYASPGVGGSVQIMTIHKAKGLEFDNVILPGLGKKSKADEKRLVFWMPHGEELLMAPIEEIGGANSGIYDFLARLNREKYTYETQRLLYVATTRTKKQLHLFGAMKEDAEHPEPSSLLAKLWPYIGQEWMQEHSRISDNSAIKSDEISNNGQPSLRRLPNEFQNPQPAEDIPIDTAVELTEEDNDKPEFKWAGIGARCLGNVLHQVFRTIGESDSHAWSADNIQTQRPQLIAALRGQGLSVSLAEKMAPTAEKAVRNLLQDTKGRWIMQKHQEARSEFPLTAWIKGRFVQRIVDRTFIDDQGVRWIIDFKTSVHEGSNLRQFFAEEKIRYQKQLEQYEELFKIMGETRPIKKALYYPIHRNFVIVD